MKPALFAAFFVLQSMTTFVKAAPLSVSDALAMKDKVQSGSFEGRAEWHALTFYLQGVIEGAAAYQQSLLAEEKAPLFCPPQNKNYSIEEIFLLLGKAKIEDNARPAAHFVLEAYANKYPCPR